jgi:methionyl-tRNA formyltransferase
MGKGRVTTMKIIFFGTPEYVVPILDTLHKNFRSKFGEAGIVAVVTQSPKPSGRKQELEYSPVDTWAYKKKITKFFESSKILNEGIKADLGIVASYGQIIPKNVIEYFPFGILNIHPSLLPKYRGASPVQATIVSGDTKTGGTIIKIDELMDHGPIVCQFYDDVLPEDSTETLRRRLFERSAEILISLIPAYLEGKINLHEQEHEKATFTKQVKKEDAFIPPEFLKSVLTGVTPVKEWQIPFIKDYILKPSANAVNNFIRAMNPWPISWTYIQLSAKSKEQSTKRIKILNAHLEKSSEGHNPAAEKLILDIVQLEGKSPVSWKQFCEGYPEATFK